MKNLTLLVALFFLPITGSAAIQSINGWVLEPQVIDGVKQFHLVAEEVKHSPDSRASGSALSYNGGLPGPTLVVQQGDKVRVLLTNRLRFNTSILIAGMPMGAGMAAAPNLAQGAVKANETWAYEFTASEAGAYVYQPFPEHLSQIERGMYGTLIVEKAGSPIDRHIVLTLHDLIVPGKAGWLPTISGKRAPYIEEITARLGQRVRLHLFNLTDRHQTVHVPGLGLELLGSKVGRSTHGLESGESKSFDFTARLGDWLLYANDVESEADVSPVGALLPGMPGWDPAAPATSAEVKQRPKVGGLSTVIKVRAEGETFEGDYPFSQAEKPRRVSRDAGYGSPQRKP